MDNRPIGIFDSGIGGFSAAKVIAELLPCEDIVYFGDSANVPYGARSKEEIVALSLLDAAFLERFDIKAALIACGTITSNAMEELCAAFPFPFFGVVNASCEAAAAITKTKKVGVIATAATIASGVYAAGIKGICGDIEVVSKACPSFAPLVEAGHFSKTDERAQRAVAQELSCFLGSGIDTLLLGCTHYPLLSGAISEFLGSEVSLVSSGEAAAHELKRHLKETGMTAERTTPGAHRWFTSGEVASFEKSAADFLGHEIRAQKMLSNEG